jgi:hypothetical protein
VDVDELRKQFEAICSDLRYRDNVEWGEPRAGHPEGSIKAHIAQLECNLAALRSKLSDLDFWKLRLLIHSHDTFKPDAERDVPIVHPRSHASLARAFLAEFVGDPDLLAMVQYHDEPFALYQQCRSKGGYNQERFKALLSNIHDWNVFLAFQIIDGCTDGKSKEPLKWFFEEIEGKVATSITKEDIL